MGGALDSLGEVSSDDQHTRHSLRNRVTEVSAPRAHGTEKKKPLLARQQGLRSYASTLQPIIAAGS